MRLLLSATGKGTRVEEGVTGVDKFSGAMLTTGEEALEAAEVFGMVVAMEGWSMKDGKVGARGGGGGMACLEGERVVVR